MKKFYRTEKTQLKSGNMIKIKLILRSLVLALIISLICIIIYAIVLSITPVSDNSMSIITQAITMISILASALYCGRYMKEKGYLYGLIIGIAYILILIPISLLWGQTLTLDKYFFARLLMASSVGIIGGIIGVNIS